MNHFGGYSQFQISVEGFWQNQAGKLYHDTHKSIWVTYIEIPENIAFFQDFRRRLEEIIGQESIFMAITRNISIL